MKRKKKILKKDILLLIILTVGYFLLQFVIGAAGRTEQLTSYRGVFTSLQFGVCLLMLLVDLKYGTRIAIFLMSLSVVSMTLIALRGERSVIPGLCNAIFYIITIIVLAIYDIKREIENRTDLVTGVSNRKGLYIKLQEKIDKNIEFSIIYFSLNNFKSINDSYGHAYGDELLRKVTRRIAARYDKDCIVSRVGGAEFVVVVDGSENVQSDADRLLDIIRVKSVLVVDGNSMDCYIDSFAGVSSFPSDATDYESLIKYADMAMAEAMANKSKEAYLFDKQMIDRMNRQMHLSNLIKEGLSNDYFYLVYQPQFDIKNKKLRGFEALLRMQTKEGEFVSPGEFIPVAERSNLIFQIDDYVLERAMREFREIVMNKPELMISINVSAKNFADLGFGEKIKDIISRTDFPAKNLEVEITEYCMVNSIISTTDNINALREAGIQIALDDFGTGYTALNYVASLPIDLLKIDKSLIDDIEKNKKRRDFVRAVITMGQLMECEVISEGVENENQVTCLREDGCDLVQGFVWGRPVKYEEAKKLALE